MTGSNKKCLTKQLCDLVRNMRFSVFLGVGYTLVCCFGLNQRRLQRNGENSKVSGRLNGQDRH